MAKKVFISAFFLVFALKLTAVNQPFLGYFASYQTISAMVAKSLMEENFRNLFLPKAFYLIQGQPAVILLFYPLDALLTAVAAKFLGGSVDLWGRFWGIFFSQASTLLLVLLTLKISRDKKSAFLTGAAFLLFPISLITGQCFMNDNLALFFFLLGYWFWLEGEVGNFRKLFIGALSASLSFMLRVHFLVFLPLFLMPIFEKTKSKKHLFFSAVPIFFMLPFVWLLYVYWEAPRQVSLHTSFFSQITEARRYALTFDFFEKFPSRVWGVVLSPIGFAFTLGGVILKAGAKEARPFYLWLLLGGVLMVILPQKVLDTPFYLLPLLPAAAYFVATVYQTISEKLKIRNWALTLLVLLHLGLTLPYVLGPLYGQLPRAPLLLEAASEIQNVSRPDEVLIVSDSSAPYALLHYGNRKGWIFWLAGSGESRTGLFPAEELRQAFEEKMKLRPAQYYVVGDRQQFQSAKNFSRWIRGKYRTIFRNEAFEIFDLRGAS